MPRTQEERREETRARLLDAAAALFADDGVEGAPVDTIAARADRTSGSVYAHFGSKEGLLLALLDGRLSEAAAVISAEVIAAPSMEERLAALWRGFADPADARRRRWVQLEHELWLYASRHPHVREQVAARYRQAGDAVAQAVDAWGRAGEADPPVSLRAVGPLVVALLVGLEMQHRLAPDLVDEAVALEGLRAVLGIGTTTEGATP